MRRLFKCEQGDAFELERVSALVKVHEMPGVLAGPETIYSGWVAVIMSRVELMVPITEADYKAIMKRRGE